MLKEKSSDFKTLVLLRVVKKLIENTESYGMYKLENILSNNNVSIPSFLDISKEKLIKKREQAIILQKSQIKEDIQSKIKMMASPKIKESSVFITPTEEGLKHNVSHKKIPAQSRFIPMKIPRRQKIGGDDTLPSHLKYLKPTHVVKKISMDLDELNPYLEDPNINQIEVEGENEKIYVVGKMGKKPISLVLDRDKIEAVIDKFSSEAKIPKTEGLFKVSINNLILTAMVSKVISSRFIIKKIKT